MKKFIVPLALMASLLVGCSDSDKEPVDKETVTVTAEPTETETDEPRGWDTPTDEPLVSDAQFAELIRAELGLPPEAPDATIVDAAEEVCTMIDMDATIEDVGLYLVDVGFDSYGAGFFVGASVQNYCPEYTDLLDEYIGGSNI